MKKLILSLVMVPLFAVALIGCGNDEVPTETNDPEVSQDQEANAGDVEEGTDTIGAEEEEEEEE